MEKEWISAFHDNEAGDEKLSFIREKRVREEFVNTLELYREIGNHLRSRNPVPELSESFLQGLRLSLQAEYERTGCPEDSQERVSVRDELQKNKAEVF